MKTINLIGPGRVGETFLHCLKADAGYAVQDVCGRNGERLRTFVTRIGVGQTAKIDTARTADIWLLAVPDGEIASVAEQLAARDVPVATALHFSGFHSADIMAPLANRGWLTASAHPNLSFADPALAAKAFKGTLVGIEGTGAAVAERLVTSLGARAFDLSAEGKVLYHAAAVVSNNFTTVLQAIASQAWAQAGVRGEIAQELGETLLRAATENTAALGPAAALTGPAARGDVDVVRAEAEALSAWAPEAGALYETLSQCASLLKRTGKPF